MYNYYVVSIKGKNARYFLQCLLKDKINVFDIKYRTDEILLKVSYDDYKRIKSYKTSCDIKVINVLGVKRIAQLYQKYKISLFIFVISVFFIMVISNMILFINIDTTDKELKKTIQSELRKNNVYFFSKQKSFGLLKKISSNIKNNNLDSIEWIEIEKEGVVLNVKVIQRINSDNSIDDNYNDIVASKDGYIRKIISRNGQIMKNVGDYVRKNEVIISGNIFRNNKVVGMIDAKGKVFAEVWYVVTANSNLYYDYSKQTNLGNAGLCLYINNTKINILNFKKKVKKSYEKEIFNSNLFSLKIYDKQIYTKERKKYSNLELKKILEKKAYDNIKNTLKSEDYIISQKTLKKYIKNGKMYVEVFFKCYEDIAVEKDIQKIEEKKEE